MQHQFVSTYTDKLSFSLTPKLTEAICCYLESVSSYSLLKLRALIRDVETKVIMNRLQ